MRNLSLLALLALSTSLCGLALAEDAPATAASDSTASEAVAVTDSVVAEATDMLAEDEMIAAEGDEKAATPSDENQMRIRSIRRNEQFYRSYGRPDLTKALVTGEFVAVVSADIADLNTARLVGIVKGAADRFAMLEDGSGNGFILRVGDKVRNGRITAITDNSVVGSISLYGMTSRVVLRLENKEG